MSVGIEAIRSALELALFGLDVTPFPTAWENKEFKPTVGTAHQRVFFMPLQPDNPTMGATHYRERGMMRVTLAYPNDGKGAQASARRAESLRGLFARGASFSDSGITVRIDRTAQVHQGRALDGWWLTDVDIFWFADIFN